MPIFHSPPHSHKSNLRYYLFATLLPIILLSLSFSFLFYDHVRRYSYTNTEIKGIRMIDLLYAALTDLQKIRGYRQISLWSRQEDIEEQVEKLEERFLARFRTPEWREEVKLFQLEDETKQLEEEARRLFTIPASAPCKTELFNQFSTLITDILQLMQLTADHACLILDPELDTYYLIDVLDRQIPYLAEAVGRVRGMGSGLLAKETVTQEERELLHTFQAAIQARIESINNAQDIIIKSSSNLQELHLLPKELDSLLSPLISECKRIENGREYHSMKPEQFFQLATRVISLMSVPYQTGITLLTSKLRHRQQRHLWQAGLFFLSTALAIILMLYFNRSFYLKDQKLHHEMEQLSITDQLTGLHNRRYFYTIFPLELRNARRNNRQLYLGLIDIDNFKRYNDTYGHPQGDLVLSRTSATMKSVLRRASDYCFRIGGEEFCILFNESDANNAISLSERLRLAIQDMNITHQENPPFGVVTVSIGLTQAPGSCDCDLEQVMSTADKALYMAKDKGRNQCVFLT